MKYSELEIVFATASPRRKALAQKIKYITPDEQVRADLRARGISRLRPVFLTADVAESACSSAERTAAQNARLKGEWAAARTKSPVLAFDTVVGVDGEVFGKPETAEQAVAMFKALCGRTHEVITAVYLRSGDKIIEKTEKTYVTFGAFDARLVYNYVASGAPFDKAGGYNIDDVELKPLITAVDGDYYNVVGLPVATTEKLIEENLIYGEDGHSY